MASISMSQPGPAASIMSPMIELPGTRVSLFSSVTCASKLSASFTNLAAARTCSPFWLHTVTTRRTGAAVAAPAAGFCILAVIVNPSALVCVQQLRGDVDVFAPGELRLGHRFRQSRRTAQAGQLDQHRQVDAGDDLDLAIVEHGDRKVRKRAAEHVGQQSDAVAFVGSRNGVDDVLPALLHIVFRPDADRRHVFLRADDVLERLDEFYRQPPVGYQDRSEEHTSELQSLMRHSYAVFCL